ncbi:MAG: hypothetical protein J5716_03430 [Alphaproteobacteria bacterium]|nr:hypothetical protein [Alphaproteobacteria bacterium]
MKKYILFLILFLTGCASATYYYPTSSRENIYPVIDEDKRQDISFSVSCFWPYAVGDDFNKIVRKEIRERLIETGLFKKVRYSFEEEKSLLHFHFMCRSGGTPQGEAEMRILLSAELLGIIPTGFYKTFDVSMMTYWNNKEIFSVTAPANQKVFIWLPLLPLILSGPISRSNMHNYAFDYVFSKIVEEKLYDPETFIRKEK